MSERRYNNYYKNELALEYTQAIGGKAFVVYLMFFISQLIVLARFK